MADLEKIQFLRSTVAGKTPTTSQLADGELAINMADYAIYTKNGSSIVQLAGKGIPETNTKKLTVDGPSALNDTVTVAEGKTITFTNENLSGEITRHIVGKCASNDGWYIGSGGTSNNGILEIGTIDDGTETIQFVQRGAGNVEARKLVLLDSSGNTTLPGDLRLSTNKTVKINNGSSLVLEMGIGSNDAYIKNQRGVGVLQLTNDSNLTFRNSQVYYAMSGRGPGKDGTLLTNVENARQLEQDNFPVTTGNETRWIKVALLKDPGSGTSRLQLMVTNGGNYGSTCSSIDFIDCSARSIPSTLTSSNIRSYLQIRRIGDPGIDNTNQMRYSLVRTSEGLELWFTQRAFIDGVKVALLSIAGGAATEYYLPTGYTTSATAPEGLVESVAIRIYDEMNKPNLDDGTDGILSVAKGGTGASTASAARTNLGLGTAATRDVGEGAGNVLENGAYGLGGNGGKSINDIISNADMLTRLKSYGGTFWRGVTKSGVSVQNGLYNHGSGIFMNAGDTMSAINIDYASAKVRVYAANNRALAAGDVKYNELYGTANKPSKADVGLGNLTNDTQVKKAGDTMTGDLAAPNLHASGPGTASVYVNAGSGNAHVWFRTNANERGVIWATPNTADLGQINIRAKTTGGTSAGDFSFRSDGRLDVPVAVKVGGAAMLTKDGNITSGSMFGGNLNNYLNTIKNDITAGDNKQVSKTGDTMTGNLTINANLKVENPSGTFVDLGSENSDKYSRLTLARKVGSGATVAMLKITPEGYVQFGYQTAVSNPAPSKYILVKSSGLEVEGDLVFNQTYRGAEDAVDITDKTNDLNNMVIKGSDLGTRLLYKCTSTGGGSNISNKPTSDGNFVLEVLSLRKISDTDWTCKQTFTTKNGDVEGTYVRYCQNGTWSAWKEVVAGVQPINLGGTGATSVAAARNNLGVGEGQSVKFGGLVVDGNINVASGNFVIASQAPTDNSHLTNKKYVDDRVASAISNAGDTYLPLAGGTVTGRLTITGDQLKTTSLWVTGDAAVNGVLTVDGRARFNQEFSVSTSVNVQNNGNSHVFFRKADGTEKGLLWVDDPGNVSIRAGGGSGPVWNFWNSGSCQFPGAISNFNGVNSTTNYPGGGIGAYLNTAGLTSRFSNGAYVSLYFQEYVGSYHQAILNVNGYGQDNSFYFRAGGDFICTRNGSFDNVEIRSDRRAKSDIKVIENALEKVEKLTGNTYELHNTSGGTTRSAGLIAQEVQEVLPEAVTQDIEADGGLLRLNYNSVIALLVESVKELSAEVKELKSQLK
ncbi:L-shaped tail fiber protein [Klebsiella phage vB_KpnM-VAC66]|nr:L-shaped tail fiber protein [Klebsiella phage vB_KpnM-VAC66]